MEVTATAWVATVGLVIVLRGIDLAVGHCGRMVYQEGAVTGIAPADLAAVREHLEAFWTFP